MISFLESCQAKTPVVCLIVAFTHDLMDAVPSGFAVCPIGICCLYPNRIDPPGGIVRPANIQGGAAGKYFGALTRTQIPEIDTLSRSEIFSPLFT